MTGSSHSSSKPPLTHHPAETTGVSVGPDRPPAQLGEAVELYLLALMSEVAETTRENYRTWLKPLVQGMGEGRILSEITAAELYDWRASVIGRAERYETHPGRPTEEGGLTLRSLHTYLQATRQFFRWLHDTEALLNNPAAKLRLPRLPREVPKAIAEEDRELLLDAAYRSGLRDYAMLCVLADTGCRLGELCSMRVSRLDLPRGQAEVTGKSGVRTIYFAEETRRALQTWLEDRPDVDDVIWAGRWGPLTESGVYQTLKRLAKAAGLQGRWNPHSFRHAVAREWARQGLDLGTISQLLGHSSSEITTRYYLRWTQDELGEMHRRVSVVRRRRGGAR
jgi:site-specific recombinase XerD